MFKGHRSHRTAFIITLLSLAWLLAVIPASQAQSNLSDGFKTGGEHLSPQARAGREIWWFATAFNDRFFTYSYQQRLGATIDWYGILGAKYRPDLFQKWGAIPNPDCCIPGEADCPARSLETTYGFPWCPGDDQLLKFVGKLGYRDPACDFEDAPYTPSEEHGEKDQRQGACDLRFGTSTGALGLRKFPNPRFDVRKWKQLNGSLSTWEGYNSFLSADTGSGDSRTNRLFDGSVEPPFRIGMSCGACHIAYDPLRPPADPDKPKWENIKGLIGNQYSRVSQMLGSGLSKHLLEWQLIARSRPGVVDTSALPMDTVHNPGTMNTIYNFASRPLFKHRVRKWHKASSCPDSKDATCWCEPGRDRKCWQLKEQDEMVNHILKGGEDSVGAAEAIQRVYFNIGSCAEQCWLNHLPDLRAVDPNQRNFGQTPFRIGQCRRDCASFRAIEDRLPDMVQFFLSERQTDLWQARGLSGREELETQLNAEYGADAVARGRKLFADNCAECHSSQPEPYDFVDFHAMVEGVDPPLRKDFLSSERPVPVTEVGTFHGRAMHSNHMPTRVWDEYAARDLAERPVVDKLTELYKGSGRGYYRPPSLLSVWAHAPFMHNNAIGPEICGRTAGANDLYTSPYVDGNNRPLENAPPCWQFDPSVEGRYALFKASMLELLNPERRPRKVSLTDAEIVFDLAPDLKIGGLDKSYSIRFPKDYPVIRLNSLRFKDLVQDMVLIERNEDKLDAKYAEKLDSQRLSQLKDGLEAMRRRMIKGALRLDISVSDARKDFVQEFYSNVRSYDENAGHTFGSKLSDDEKSALIAFLATL